MEKRTEPEATVRSEESGTDGNALAEIVIGLFKTEVVKHLGPWKPAGQLE